MLHTQDLQNQLCLNCWGSKKGAKASNEINSHQGLSPGNATKLKSVPPFLHLTIHLTTKKWVYKLQQLCLEAPASCLYKTIMAIIFELQILPKTLGLTFSIYSLHLASCEWRRRKVSSVTAVPTNEVPLFRTAHHNKPDCPMMLTYLRASSHWAPPAGLPPGPVFLRAVFFTICSKKISRLIKSCCLHWVERCNPSTSN